jgi:hypothetical protein
MNVAFSIVSEQSSHCSDRFFFLNLVRADHIFQFFTPEVLVVSSPHPDLLFARAQGSRQTNSTSVTVQHGLLEIVFQLDAAIPPHLARPYGRPFIKSIKQG